MSHFMVDLETLGTVPGCAILSIGIIAFDPMARTMEQAFSDDGCYLVVNREDCLANLLHEDASTISWWNSQSEAARQVLKDAADRKTSIPLKLALEKMGDYVAEHCSPGHAKIYGNGADFDNAILAVAAFAVGHKFPWRYGSRCYRTLKNLHEVFGPRFAAPKVERGGTYHNALDDAKTQARHLMQIIGRISPN